MPKEETHDQPTEHTHPKQPCGAWRQTSPSCLSVLSQHAALTDHRPRARRREGTAASLSPSHPHTLPAARSPPRRARRRPPRPRPPPRAGPITLPGGPRHAGVKEERAHPRPPESPPGAGRTQAGPTRPRTPPPSPARPAVPAPRCPGTRGRRDPLAAFPRRAALHPREPAAAPSGPSARAAGYLRSPWLWRVRATRTAGSAGGARGRHRSRV